MRQQVRNLDVYAGVIHERALGGTAAIAEAFPPSPRQRDLGEGFGREADRAAGKARAELIQLQGTVSPIGEQCAGMAACCLADIERGVRSSATAMME